MKGFYLYGVCPFGKTKELSRIEGLNGQGEVFFVSYQDIKAIVSEVSLKEFESEEIKRKANEDLRWIKDKALLHEKVLEKVTKAYSDLVIPMKFGMIFKTKEGVLNSLKENYSKFKDLFKKLREKEEWSVKIYLKPQLLENEIKNTSPTIQRKMKEINSLPAGKAYFLEEEINEAVKVESRNSIDNYISSFLERIGQLVEEIKENKILGKELTQKNDPMVFNGAFLVKKEKVDRFQEEIQKLRVEYGKIGFTFESSGPWPPYNFV
ncbi:GvpL/GvpF family gas vesicle protein [Candidatus Parcubacteria bacterium]|nr:GvpL/GvpF family gas vesicle protein [Patescibacteria group bacterium]MCG2688558.1 GvpL/GvpF family gas vesicle protein [Candidatus Parcubacteria bacterium]